MTTRDRLIEGTAELVQAKGYYATGINEILEKVGVPRGSLYHHFPKGKDDLVAEAIMHAGAVQTEVFRNAMKGKGAAANGLSAVVDVLADQLLMSNYKKGCPLATVALEVSLQNDAMQKVCSRILMQWQDHVASFLEYKGEEQADEKARLFLTMVEGAFILSKTHKDITYLKAIKGQLKLMFS